MIFFIGVLGFFFNMVSIVFCEGVVVNLSMVNVVMVFFCIFVFIVGNKVLVVFFMVVVVMVLVLILFFKLIMICCVVFSLIFFIVFSILVFLVLIIFISLVGERVERIIWVVFFLIFEMEISSRKSFCFCLLVKLYKM